MLKRLSASAIELKYIEPIQNTKGTASINCWQSYLSFSRTVMQYGYRAIRLLPSMHTKLYLEVELGELEKWNIHKKN